MTWLPRPPRATSEHSQNGLDIGTRVWLLGCFRRVLSRHLWREALFWQRRRAPWSVLAHVGGEDLHDGPIISGRVTSDPLERVDTAQAYLQVRLTILQFGPKLPDRLREAVRY